MHVFLICAMAPPSDCKNVIYWCSLMGGEELFGAISSNAQILLLNLHPDFTSGGLTGCW